jgi:hypothetical protein
MTERLGRVLGWSAAWLRQILLMHLSAARSRTFSAASSPEARQAIQQYLGIRRAGPATRGGGTFGRRAAGPVTIPG